MRSCIGHIVIQYTVDAHIHIYTHYLVICLSVSFPFSCFLSNIRKNQCYLIGSAANGTCWRSIPSRNSIAATNLLTAILGGHGCGPDG